MSEQKRSDDSPLRASVETVSKYWHTDPYYDRAEQADWLSAFWTRDRPQRPFLPMFEQLNLRCVVELACGHGRHAAKIVDAAPALILMDAVEENIAFCKERFKTYANVVAIQNDGYSFRPLPDGEITAVFCYDAMVHFEFDVALAYVRDAARILTKGGRALFHHSILSAFPGRDHRENPGGRNFMSLEAFKHTAVRAGFEVLQSTIMDWDVPNTDALTLLEKVTN